MFNVDNDTNRQTNDQSENKKYISAPYIPNVTERINKIFKPHNITLSSKCPHTIGNILRNVKQKRDSGN